MMCLSVTMNSRLESHHLGPNPSAKASVAIHAAKARRPPGGAWSAVATTTADVVAIAEVTPQTTAPPR